MAPREGRGDVTSFQIKIWAFYAVIFADLAINSVWGSTEGDITRTLLFFGAQFFSLVGTTALLYLLMMNTTYLQVGLFGSILVEFRWTFVVTFIHYTLFFILRIYRLVAQMNLWPYLALWDMGGFRTLFIIQKIVAIIYYTAYLYSARRMGDDDLYDLSKVKGAFNRNG